MRKFLLVCILTLLCGCTPKPHVILQPPISPVIPSVEAEAPTAEVKQEPPQIKEPAPEVTACTFSISCAVLCENLDILDAAKHELVPPTGQIFAPTPMEFEEGESVFDLLRRVCREHGILMEFTMSPVYESAYIEGIGNLYEFDGGPQSGWVYKVNGVTPNVGCSSYALKAGDVVVWEYTIQ